MNRVLVGSLAAAALGLIAASCSDALVEEDTGTKPPDSGRADTATLPDIAAQDHAIKPDGGGSSSLKWAVSAGGASSDEGNSIAADGAGNSYLTGHFEGTATFGSTTLTSMGGADIFVAKLDSAGKFVWAVSAGGTSWDYGHSITVDSTGNCYVVGEARGTATFGSTTLTPKGSSDIFVTKLDSSGKFIWAVSAGGTKADRGSSIAVDSSGNCYVTGYFIGPASFGSTTLTSMGLRDIFAAKVDSGGKFVWAVSAGGVSFDHGASVAVDAAGNSYVTGDFGGTASFGGTTLTSMGGADIFIAKLDSAGKFVWAVSAGGTSGQAGSSIAVDAAGHNHVSGRFEGTVSFGGTTLISKGNADIFVAELDSNGKFVAAVSAGGSKGDLAYSIAASGSGHAYVTGLFEGTAVFGGTTLTSKGALDVFVAKLDSSGKFVAVVSAGGAALDGGRSIAVNSAGDSYVSGYFNGTATFGSTTLISKGNADIFVAKLGQ